MGEGASSHRYAPLTLQAKTQAECLDYLCELGVKMKLAGLNPELSAATNLEASIEGEITQSDDR